MAAKGSAEHKAAISKGIKRHHRLKKKAAKEGRVYKKRKVRSDSGVKKGTAFKLGPKFKKNAKKLAKKSTKKKAASKAKTATKAPAKPKRKKRADKGKKRGINQMATLRQMNKM